MKKDNIRDYATEAFRFYAALGKPDYKTIKQALYDRALQEEQKREVHTSNSISSAVESQIRNAQLAVEELKAELLDILAVENTLKILTARNDGRDIIKAIETVYFTEPRREIRRGEIQERVKFAALLIPTSEPTVYRHLRAARNIFAVERGLRCAKVDSSRFKLSDIMVP